MGKPGEAIKVYEEGISKYSDNYLHYYNAGLTYEKIHEFEKAEQDYISALRVNPIHASSFLGLTNIYIQENKQLPALLTICRFLLLEPNTERSVDALNKLDLIMNAGVHKKDSNINISVLSLDEKDNPYATIEFGLKMMSAANLSGDVKEISLFNPDSFGYDFSMIFEMLKADKKYNDFIGINLFPYYLALVKSGNAQTFMFYIQQNSNRRGIKKWLTENNAKIDSLADFENNCKWEIK
jgi:tetratricopeptide (TPR) repeat protein